MTNTDVLEVYILAYLDYEAKSIGFVGRANAVGYGVPHPGTAVHPNYRGSLLDSMAYYRVVGSEFLIWSCECVILSEYRGMGLLDMLKDVGFKMKHVGVVEMKRKNALYASYSRQDD